MAISAGRKPMAHGPGASERARSPISQRAVLLGSVLALTLGALAAPVQATTTATAARPTTWAKRTSAKKTLHLPDGKRTAHVWKTWYKKPNGKYYGHYGFTSASKRVSVYVITKHGTRTLSKGRHYSYSNESYVWLFACDNDYPNGDDCTTNW